MCATTPLPSVTESVSRPGFTGKQRAQDAKGPMVDGLVTVSHFRQRSTVPLPNDTFCFDPEGDDICAKRLGLRR